MERMGKTAEKRPCFLIALFSILEPEIFKSPPHKLQNGGGGYGEWRKGDHGSQLCSILSIISATAVIPGFFVPLPSLLCEDNTLAAPEAAGRKGDRAGNRPIGTQPAFS